MKALFSIKPDFAEAILNGRKRFEFRKTRFRRAISTIAIYSTSPVSAVVGEAKVRKIHISTPEAIWRKCAVGGAIDKNFYDSYFEGSPEASAIELFEILQFETPIPLELYAPGTKPPQSFVYLDDKPLSDRAKNSH
ncbi:MAG: ASCH domain-containing protein [Fimbriimonadaceae bacterium]